MKINFFLLTFFAVPFMAHSQITDPAPYCSGAFDNQNGTSTNYISSVSIGSWENETGTTASAGGHYRFYNNITAPVLTKGDDYVFTIIGNNANDVVGHFLAVYIDFNQDDDFDDAGERIMHYDFMALAETSEATVTIPTTAATGTTRMRVILFEDDEYTWIDSNDEATPCTVYENGLLDWGETEDYNVNIQVAAEVEEENSAAILCYPNPAGDVLTVQYKMENARYKIYNSNGAIVMNGTTSYHAILSVETLPAGFYMIEVETGKEVLRQSFLKN